MSAGLELKRLPADALSQPSITQFRLGNVLGSNLASWIKRGILTPHDTCLIPTSMHLKVVHVLWAKSSLAPHDPTAVQQRHTA
jgi:hypothetical protein